MHRPKIMKNMIWNHLKSLNDILTLPWCSLGDFNEMLHLSEKIRGTPLCASKLQRLNDFLSLCKGHDANVQGRILMWKNFLHGKLICEKLDRVILRRTVSISSRITAWLMVHLRALTTLIFILILNLLTLLERAPILDINIHGLNIMKHTASLIVTGSFLCPIRQ